MPGAGVVVAVPHCTTDISTHLLLFLCTGSYLKVKEDWSMSGGGGGDGGDGGDGGGGG